MNYINKNHGNYKHGLCRTSIYLIWTQMRKRCNSSHYMNECWNGRGIKVCKEWDNFMNFYNWALKNGYKKGLTLDRIDNDGNYEPQNCRFVDWSIQNSNKRKFKRLPRDYDNYIN